MLTEDSIKLSNRILLCHLLHLARVIIFSALPVTLHISYVEYRRYFDALPPYQGMPPPVPVYPFFVVFPAITLIIFELEAFRRFWMNTAKDYEILTFTLFIFEWALLYFTPVLYLRAEYYPGIMPIAEITMLFLGVSVLGFLEIVLTSKDRLVKRMGLGRL